MAASIPLSNEELIALALTAAPDEAVPKNKDEATLAEVEQFIFENDIKIGREKIRRYQVLDLVERWGKAKAKPKFFMRKFGTIFKRNMSNNGPHYLLDPAPFNTSEEFKFSYKEQTRNAVAMRKKLRAEKIVNQKKQSEISGSNPQCQPKDEMGTD